MLIGGIMLQAPRGIETLYLIPIMRATKSNGRLGGAVVAMFALLILGTADTVGMHQFSLASLGFMELFRVVAYAFAILLVESMVDRITATENLAVTDPLTGVFNRLGFASQVQSIISRAMMARKQVTLVLIDLDDFKTLNDQHGHQFGDEILKALVQSLEPALANRNGVLGRTGGDEFQMLFVDISREDITRALLRAAARFSDQTLVLGHRSTFSFGIAESDMVGYLVTHLTEAADAEMYHRKSSKTFGHMA